MLVAAQQRGLLCGVGNVQNQDVQGWLLRLGTAQPQGSTGTAEPRAGCPMGHTATLCIC